MHHAPLIAGRILNPFPVAVTAEMEGQAAMDGVGEVPLALIGHLVGQLGDLLGESALEVCFIDGRGRRVGHGLDVNDVPVAAAGG